LETNWKPVVGFEGLLGRMGLFHSAFTQRGPGGCIFFLLVSIWLGLIRLTSEGDKKSPIKAKSAVIKRTWKKIEVALAFLKVSATRSCNSDALTDGQFASSLGIHF
jgi:hypothetical protein